MAKKDKNSNPAEAAEAKAEAEAEKVEAKADVTANPEVEQTQATEAAAQEAPAEAPATPNYPVYQPPAPGKSNGARNTVIALASLALAASVVAMGFSILTFVRNGQPITIYSGSDGNSANFTDGSVADIAQKVSPSVVSIVTETRTTSWFGQSSTSSAAGTGIIVSEDGYVLTNKHVVDGANTIKVVMDDGTTYSDVKLVGTDPINDVAFIKISGVSGLQAATLGNSKTINVGQQVIAIGNALGQYQNTVTEGIISGTGRSITATDSSYSTYETLNDMIQTDAAINGGNSGGPLVNAAGEVIGINTAVSDGNGIGFAIPISAVKGMLKNVLENGKAERAYLGVNYISLTPDVAKSYGLSANSGAYVHNSSGNPVISGSPAEKAGLKEGDIITAINGEKVGGASSVATLIGEYKPGDTVQFTVLRDGKETSLKATLEAYPTSLNSSNSMRKQ